MSAAPEGPTATLQPASAWRQIVDSAQDTAIISTDREGRVQTWSAGAESILGWSEAEMVGHDLARIFLAEDQAAGRLRGEMSEAVVHGRGGGEEGWRVRKDGSRFWAVGELSPIRSDDGSHVGFVKVLRDRTGQRLAEEAVREQRHALEVMNRVSSALAVEAELPRLVQLVIDAGVELTGARSGAFFYNVHDSSADGVLLWASSGAPIEPFAAFAMPHDARVFAATFAGRGIVRRDDVTRDPHDPDAAPRPSMPAEPPPVRSTLAVPVISRTGAVIGGLFFGHDEVGRFTEKSERNLSGLAAEAAVAIDNARLAQATQQEIAERRKAEEALRNLNATLEQQVQERTQELNRNAEVLRQSQKMEALGQLTGGVAHDFNNLLQIIVGNLETLRRHLPKDSQRLQRAAETAMNGARRASSLTQRLLAFARRQPLDPKAVDPNVLVRGMSELLHRTLGETIAVEAVLAAGLWRVEVDPNQLEAAILNLAVNARDAMPDGGRLTIETSNARIDEGYVQSQAEVVPGQYVVLSVSDTGLGMDTRTLAQAFEPFFTTKPVGKGTGLGLSQVYGFVKQSGGNVKIYSEPGSGTTVRVYLPRRHAPDDDAPSAIDGLSPEAAHDETILVLEDDDDVRAYSVETLRELGYRVIEAHDGAAAIRLIERQSKIDLLFTDVVLPGGLTGAQVAAQARALRPQLRVLFTTGYARDAIVHHGRLDSGVQLITKPFTYSDLAKKVRDVLEAAQ